MPFTVSKQYMLVMFLYHVRCWGVYAGIDIRVSICTEKADFV